MVALNPGVEIEWCLIDPPSPYELTSGELMHYVIQPVDAIARQSLCGTLPRPGERWVPIEMLARRANPCGACREIAAKAQR